MEIECRLSITQVPFMAGASSNHNSRDYKSGARTIEIAGGQSRHDISSYFSNKHLYCMHYTYDNFPRGLTLLSLLLVGSRNREVPESRGDHETPQTTQRLGLHQKCTPASVVMYMSDVRMRRGG